MKLQPRSGALVFGLSMLALSLAGPSAAVAGRLGLDLHGLSYHFDRRAIDGREFENANPGGGIDWVIRQGPRHTLFADVGAFRDSFRNTSSYGSLSWTRALLGPLQGGVGLAIESTPSVNDGELYMAPRLLLSLRTDRAALNVAYLPLESNVNPCPSLATWATIYPCGPVRAGRAEWPDAATAIPDSSLDTGIEFTIDSKLTLSSPDGATIALKRRSGDHGWRIAGLVSGYDDMSTVDDEDGSTAHESASYNLEGRAQRLAYFPRRKGPELFLGYGALLGYANAARLWRVGLVGTCGVEWRLADIISLGAEYGLDFIYTDSHYERNLDAGAYTTRDWSLDLQPRTVRLALTAWFD
ncbi:MAG: hypothetical protein ACYDIE_11185 [Candidatus Krumholzibacteriia bacterium]